MVACTCNTTFFQIKSHNSIVKPIIISTNISCNSFFTMSTHSKNFFLQVFITNGILSNLVIVVAITDPTAKSNAHGITLFLVEDGMPGE